jgi:hypothetical protein
MEGKVCTKCGVWKPLEEYNKFKKGKCGRYPSCRECQKEHNKQWYQNNKEHSKQWYQNNKEHKKEYDRQYRENNKEHIKQYRENNKEHYKELNKEKYESNKEYYKEYSKQKYENNKENNLQYISSIVEQINPVFNQLNLPVYGYIYRFKNIKTKRYYIGQTITSLKHRYNNDVIKGWVKERLKYNGQKFIEELIKEDFIVTETLDVAFCQYHLDKLEAYYINKYDSYNNGYNNNAGRYNVNDGYEEFEKILKKYGLEFIDGKLIGKEKTSTER